MRKRYPDAEFAGVGGDAMRAAGFDAWFDASELAVMGLAEVLRHLPRLLRLRRALRARLLAWQPDVFIGIDAPDFNLGLERWLKQRGVRTVHYVSPSVWAWRESRAEKIGRSADRVLCLFPMEPPIYARHGVDARFVGHPLADALPLEPDRDAARASLGIERSAPVLALLPGSRVGEIERLAADFIAAAAQVLRQEPRLRIVAPMANAHAREAFSRVLATHPDHAALQAALHVTDGGAQAAMIAADVVLLASGTATLEAMLCKRPMVVAYKVSALTYRLVKGLGMLKVDALRAAERAGRRNAGAGTDAARLHAGKPRRRSPALAARPGGGRSTAATLPRTPPGAASRCLGTRRGCRCGVACSDACCASPASTKPGAGRSPARWWSRPSCSIRRGRASTA